MDEQKLPSVITRPMQFANGSAIGISVRWQDGQFCLILARAGLVGCGIFDVVAPAEFGEAVAIAYGTPDKPLVDPEDLLEAKIAKATPQAKALGIEPGMTGREATERLLAAQ
jgi:uncharacterized protein YunC (DUF1805 family)